MTMKRKAPFFGNGKYYIKIKIMKKYIIIISLVLLACSSNKLLQSDNSDCTFNDNISDDEKIININPYKNKLYKKGFYTLIENDSVENYITINSKGFSKKKINKITNLLKIINYDTITLKVTNSFSFYKKGSFNIGNEYIYNDKGEIIKTIDHNQYDKYPICYKEIIKTVLKKAGRKYYLHALERDSINVNGKLNYTWNIVLNDTITKYPTIISKRYIVDAKTFQILKEAFIRRLPM